MKTIKEDIFIILSGIITGICIGFSAAIGHHRGQISIQQEAIRKGHAEWVADGAGQAQFKWKECK
jgi:hypothetical protein